MKVYVIMNANMEDYYSIVGCYANKEDAENARKNPELGDSSSSYIDEIEVQSCLNIEEEITKSKKKIEDIREMYKKEIEKSPQKEVFWDNLQSRKIKRYVDYINFLNELTK